MPRYLVDGVDISASFNGHGIDELDRLDTVQFQFDVETPPSAAAVFKISIGSESVPYDHHVLAAPSVKIRYQVRA